MANPDLAARIADQLNVTVVTTRQLARRARVGMRNALAALSDDDWAVP